MAILFALATGILFAVGVFQLLRRDMIKAGMGFAVLFTAINLFILSVGAFEPETPAYAGQTGQMSDPLVQALILTAIVVGFGSYALLLSMINSASRRYETLDSDELSQLRK